MQKSAFSMKATALGVIGLSSVVLLCGCRSEKPPGDGGPISSSTTKDAPNTDRSQPERQTAARFENTAELKGIRFVPKNGQEHGHLSILESLGSGVALLDYDNDGQLDLWLSGGGTFSDRPEPIGLRGALFRSVQSHYVDVSDAARLPVPSFYTHGVNVADFDNDGFTDVLITGYRGVALYRNQGDGTFFIENKHGLPTNGWSTGAAWADVNGDGNLDLFLANYLDWSFDNHPSCLRGGLRDVCAPADFTAIDDVLMISGADGSFIDQTDAWGLVGGGKGLAVLGADMDLDGDTDFYVANDTTPNFLYRNDGDRLTEIGLLSGTSLDNRAQPNGSMGIDFGDLDGDLLPDLWVANFEDENMALYRNFGDLEFQDRSSAFGISAAGTVHVGFGTSLLDFDRDGDLDIFVTNGHVMRHPVNSGVRQKPLLFENLNAGRFVDVAADAGEYLNTTHMGRGLAVGDMDRDGDLDITISHINEPVALLENRTEDDRHWLAIKLVGTDSSRDAVGATVYVKAGDRTFISPVAGGTSYLSTNDRTLFFGLGASDHADSVEIRWPSGRQQVYADVHKDFPWIAVEKHNVLIRLHVD